MRVECFARVDAVDRMGRGLPAQCVAVLFALVTDAGPESITVPILIAAARRAVYTLGWSGRHVVEMSTDLPMEPTL